MVLSNAADNRQMAANVIDRYAFADARNANDASAATPCVAPLARLRLPLQISYSHPS